MNAEQRVASVRDDPEGRYRLRVDFYKQFGFDRLGGAGYGTSELAFLRWEIDRGVLNPLSHPTCPGSPWWRSVNEAFLLSSEQAADIQTAAADGADACEAVQLWLRYFRQPSRKSWYRAHNGSIAAGYLQAMTAAGAESRAEQIFVNIVLYRVLYAQALAEGDAPGLFAWFERKILRYSALLAKLESLLADPRGLSVDVLVHLPDFYPRHYPLTDDDLRHLLMQGHGLEEDAAKGMDELLIVPDLTRLYHLAARWIRTPRLRTLVAKGRPCYPLADG